MAFNKPGMKQIIQSSGSGRTFSATELVGFLARFMHLDNIRWVRNRVRTTGKESVGLINFKVTGEKNIKNFQNLRDDLKGLRLARIMNSDELSQVPESDDLQSVTHSKYGGDSNDKIITQSVATAKRVSQNVSKLLSLAEKEEKICDNSNDNKTNYEKSFAKTARFMADTVNRRDTKGAYFVLNTISEVSKEYDDLYDISHNFSHSHHSHSIVNNSVGDGGNSGEYTEHTGSMLYHQELDAFDKAMQKFQADADQTATDLQKYLDYYGKHHVKISVEACLLCSDE
jgi:hypothetical protein